MEHDLFAGDQRELATEIYNKINKSTLGQLLKQLAKSADFSGDLELLLANAIAERNQLFHSFYRKHNFRRNADEGRAKMIEDLDRKHETILEAYKAVMRTLRYRPGQADKRADANDTREDLAQPE